jgi:hypothetical protein
VKLPSSKVLLAKMATSAAGRAWAVELTDALARGERLSELRSAFAQAGRQVGRQPLGGQLPEADERPLAVLRFWGADDAARAALLMAFAQGRPDDLQPMVEELYHGGDGREKAAIVRALPLLPQPDRFIAIAADAGRATDLGLFGALAAGNAYASLHYAEREWNVLLMKVVFVGLSVNDVLGAARRRNPDLSRMALDYVSERRAAGRAVPESTWELFGPAPSAEAVERLAAFVAKSPAAEVPPATAALERMRSSLIP